MIPLLSKPSPLLPPRRLIEHVGGNFIETGEEFRRHFIEQAALAPGHHVLDVGCGCGRIAVALTSYLSAAGSYAGFDVDRAGIDWCRRRITPRFPNFRFLHADLFNQVYNPRGALPASGYRFPYPDGRFDLVCLTSVFTHALWPDMVHYLQEISRVLKPGGRCLSTFFLLNAESESRMDRGLSDFVFPYLAFNCRLAKSDRPEFAVAFPEPLVRGAFQACALELRAPPLYGSWAGRPDGLSYQDIVVAVKGSGPE